MSLAQAPPAAAAAEAEPRRPGHLSFLQAAEATEAHELLEKAILADQHEQWGEALTLYAQATRVLRERESLRPSRPLRLAIDKAEQERRASLRLLELLGRERVPRAADHTEQQSDEDPRLEAGRLLRRKVALALGTGHVPPAALAQHARVLLQAVSRPRPSPSSALPRTEAASLSGPEAELERCALEAAVSDRPRARAALARVLRATRELPSLAGAMAVCRAALGESREALRYLIAGFGELPPPGPEDDHGLSTTTWRELFLLDDWNELRGDPAFEQLFSHGQPRETP
jgi:hypothetical protein